MKKQSRTVPRRRQSVSPTPRHLPLVDILIDTQAELQELVVASGLKVLEAMLEEDRAAVCGPRYAHQPARQAYRTRHTPSQVVLGGRKVAIRRPRARRAGEEVPLPTPGHWRCCMNRHWPARCQPAGSSPADAIRRWSAEGGHPIEDFTAEDDLTPLPGWTPGAKAIADDGLVAEERVLHPALTMVP